MSLDSTLRGLAAEIGQSRTPTGSVAAPAKLRHRTGTINAYTAGNTTASVIIGADTIDAPFLATYSPVTGDAVSVLVNNGSPLILGAVNAPPTPAPSAVAAFGYFDNFSGYAFDGTIMHFDEVLTPLPPVGLFEIDAVLGGVRVLVDCVGQGYFYGEVTGCDPGDRFLFRCDFGPPDSGGRAEFTASAGGTLAGTVLTQVNSLGAGDLAQVSIIQISGTGTTPVLGSTKLQLIRLS